MQARDLLLNLLLIALPRGLLLALSMPLLLQPSKPLLLSVYASSFFHAINPGDLCLLSLCLSSCCSNSNWIWKRNGPPIGDGFGSRPGQARILFHSTRHPFQSL
uniref:Uncharacterized protein n=1 Tax=Picea glauca TaxID=3330 RepID=A0A101M250_PICGL|nr:hypothetical protein ABT39_MTgene2749 [Picea glauca]